jgi:cell division protein FtsB
MNRRRKNRKIISMSEAQEKRREKRALQRSRRGAKRANPFFVYRKSYIAVLLFLLVMSSVYAVRIVALKVDEARAAAELESARERKARLEEELAYIDDPVYIEQQARTRLRMVKPGEIYYVLPEKDAETADGVPAAEKADAE